MPDGGLARADLALTADRLTARHSTSRRPGGALALVTSGEPRTSFSLQACGNTKNLSQLLPVLRVLPQPRSAERISPQKASNVLMFWLPGSPCQLRPWHRFVSKLPADDGKVMVKYITNTPRDK